MPYEDIEFKIVVGIDGNKYFRIKKDNKTTYHLFRSKKHIIPKKFGNYGVVKQERVEATSYDVGENEFLIVEKKELDIEIIKGLVGINFNF